MMPSLKPKAAIVMAKDRLGGLLLVACCLLAFVWATLHPTSYSAFKLYPLAEGISWQLFVNDLLMVLFFLMVGLELSNEAKHGVFRTKRAIVLPLISACAGFICPAVIYLALIGGFASPMSSGWAIVTATDIALALGLLSLCSRVPVSLKMFLLAVAIFDDMLAIITIAVFYTTTFEVLYLCLSVGITVLIFWLTRRQAKSLSLYLALGTILWFVLLKAGIHPVLAGVVIGFALSQSGCALSHRTESGLQWGVTLLVLPMFALSNAGVSLAGTFTLENVIDPVAAYIAIAMLIGKPLGVFGSVWLGVRMKIFELPEATNLRMLFALSIFCSIGLTLSLFIGELSGLGNDHYKLGIVVAALVASILGLILMHFATRQGNGVFQVRGDQ
ncbi:Na+/H+ antiporter NhaA [Photobacterium sp. DNB23_23_1]|uniref:Na(+)/H(+) antiporter NhaA n=1 Tax=Photobacterium pectinilyticum TaxID=2906793 RepID=A0ABT1N3I8_9GAMM|nr:Na+/H+ antiporter NhaA [Photobacterium sp. ZSDE20]MCQ1058677.1 Na+/H+ antiporter NhaA [Photobacterium sp. ZSDE20]MDD1823391.1 Na+/H+ antiporter NhaA [Photobacterium sp. ZSDE20]